MNVAFLIGPKSDKIASSMSNSADNVKFLTYSDIQSMIKSSTMRHVFFDRIVFSENILGNIEEDLTALNSYITEYSDNTSVVMVCKSMGEESINIFNKIFNSPLYTPAIAEKITIKVLLEFVTGDILAIKANYYSNESQEVKAVSNRYIEEPKKVENKPVEKPVKRGFFSSLFGGKKNSAPNTENQNIPQEVSETVGKADEMVANNVPETPVESFTPDVGNSGLSSPEWTPSINELEGNEISDGIGSGSVGGQDFGDDFSLEISEEDNLGIGDFGEQHLDTGFLDEEDEQELINSLSAVEKEEEHEEEVISEQQVGVDKITIMLGLRGTGVTTKIADKAIGLTEQGFHVLIIDLDYKENGILSFIDTEKFFSMNSSGGIDEKKVYEEDGVSIMSNGYGRGVSVEALTDVLESSEIYYKYDYIIIDCPLDCIDCLSKDILESSSVLIYVNGNKGALTSTIKYLVSRESSFEDMLFERSKIIVENKISEYNDDVASLKKSILFGRGNWLSKLN